MPFKKITPLLLAIGLPLSAPSVLACGSDPYLGEVCTFATTFCPVGFAEANGMLLQVSQNPALFSLLGYSFGGNGTTTFALPDLRGRSVVGLGTIPTTAITVGLGTEVGTTQGNGMLTAAKVPGHSHPATFQAINGQSTVNIPATTGNLSVSANLTVNPALGNTTSLSGTGSLAAITAKAGATTMAGPYSTSAPTGTGSIPVNVTVSGTPSTPATTTQITTVTGGNVTVQTQNGAPQAVATVSPGLGLRYCIATEGLYPSRP